MDEEKFVFQRPIQKDPLQGAGGFGRMYPEPKDAQAERQADSKLPASDKNMPSGKLGVVVPIKRQACRS